MAQNPSGLDMFREIVGQINNLRKLVTVNGKQYRYDPKSKGYKADGKTFTPSQLKAKLKGQSYTAPKIDNKSKIKIKPKLKRTGKLYPGGISRPDKGRYGRNLPSKDKYGVPSQKKRLLKPKTTPKASVKTKLGNAANTVKKSLKIKNVTNVAKNLKGTVGKGAVYGLVQHGANKIVDDTLANIFKRKGETTAEYQARVEKAKANLGKKRKLKPKTKVTNRRGRVIKKVNDLKGDKELSTSIRGRQRKNPPPTPSKKDITANKTKTDNKDAGAGASNNQPQDSNNEKVKVNKKKVEWGDTKEGKEAKKTFMKRVKAGKNIAANAGMDPDKLWERRKQHRKFLKTNKRKLPTSLR